VALRFGSSGMESRFEADVGALAASLGHADRAAPFRSYCAGLILPGDRKSVEPMAARVEPPDQPADRTGANPRSPRCPCAPELHTGRCLIRRRHRVPRRDHRT
jgi:hypothetical protein